jgi:serine protease Do
MTDELRQKYTIDADIKGVVVTEVTPDSAAADKKFEPGDGSRKLVRRQLPVSDIS